jgi:hypothetical protein
MAQGLLFPSTASISAMQQQQGKKTCQRVAGASLRSVRRKGDRAQSSKLRRFQAVFTSNASPTYAMTATVQQNIACLG